ncbi:MAG TPA: succinate dehydrogenase/fumarate reductase iron-sulfur subunit [Stellaceae bacterium]|nr:succinate dehydrogenase/fumarate reductase iron-sulfur subunit [Stellaceae bacterium]
MPLDESREPRGELPKEIILNVLRYRPGADEKPVPQSYRVPFTEDMSVLQALQYVKDHVDGSLTFRWSCRMAICGSCGMMINGEPRLACMTFLREYPAGTVEVEALRNFPIERDLVVTVADFVRKIASIYPYLIPKAARSLAEGEYLQTPAELARYEPFSDCINCMLCYAACPQFAENPDFIGPGAMALLQRYNGDSRDGGSARRMELVHGENGAWSCTAVGYCSEVCPKSVDPANAVNQNKTRSALDFFLRWLPGGGR